MTNQEFKVSIKDFQIIKNADLTFLPGLNAIIGQSNNGKSAIFRAIKSCIYNTPGTSYVRIGKNNYAVGIQYNEHTIILQKGQANLYKIDGKVYEKIGRTQLPEVAEALKIKDLNLNGINEQINFQDQMEKPFLLDRSETDLFRFIVDSGKDSNVTNALKTITQDRQQLTKEISITEGALTQIEKDIEEQKNILENADTKINLCESIINIGPKMSQLNNMKSLVNLFKKHLDTSEELTKLVSKLVNSSAERELSKSSIETYLKKKDVVQTLLNNIKVSTNKKDKLSSDLKVINKITKSELNKLYERYNKTSELQKSLRTSKNTLTELNNIKIPEVNSSINKYIESIKLYQSIKEKQNTRISYNKSIEAISQEYKELQQEINSIGVCPTCGKPLHD